ncbi:MAG: hypothetical protein ABEJ76_01120 [Halanaeroarchaeum sp.]
MPWIALSFTTYAIALNVGLLVGVVVGFGYWIVYREEDGHDSLCADRPGDWHAYT